jgi:hypothetical protein
VGVNPLDAHGAVPQASEVARLERLQRTGAEERQWAGSVQGDPEVRQRQSGVPRPPRPEEGGDGDGGAGGERGRDRDEAGSDATPAPDEAAGGARPEGQGGSDGDDTPGHRLDVLV